MGLMMTYLVFSMVTDNHEEGTMMILNAILDERANAAI